MTFWIFNLFLWWLTNGALPPTSYSTCVQLTPAGIVLSNACEFPTPELTPKN